MKVKDAFIPGDTVDVYGCPAAIFCVYNKFTTDNGFEGSIDAVKSLIARGIPVVITMSTVADGSETPTILQAYKSGTLDIPCTVDARDHQMI